MKQRLERLTGAFRGDGFVRSVGVLAGGAAVGQAAALLASPILTRLYTPDDFGALGVFASVLGVASVAATLRYELAIPLADKNSAAANTLALTLIMSLGFSAVIGLAVTPFSGQITSLLGAPSLSPYVFLIPLGVLTLGAYASLNYWAIRRRAFGHIARTKLNQGLSGVIAQLGLGAIGLTPLGLLLGHIVSQVAGMLTLSRLVERNDMSLVNASGIKAVAVQYQRFPRYSFPGALMNSASLSLPPLLLASLFGPAVAGLYFFTQRILRAPLALISQAVSQVYYGEAAHLVNDDPERLLRLHSTTSRQLVRVAVLPMLVLAFAGGPLFSTIFGEAWREAGVYAQLLAPFLLAQFVVAPLSQTFSLLEAQRLLLLVNASKLGLSVAPIVLTHFAGLQATVAVGAFSIGLSVNYALVFFLSRQLIRQRIATHKTSEKWTSS